MQRVTLHALLLRKQLKLKVFLDFQTNSIAMAPVCAGLIVFENVSQAGSGRDKAVLVAYACALSRYCHNLVQLETGWLEQVVRLCMCMHNVRLIQYSSALQLSLTPSQADSN